MGLSLRKERFNRVMANRKDRAIEALKSLGNIANRNNYEFADEEVTVVYGELLAELKKVFSGSLIGKISALLNISNLNAFKKRLDPRLYNGAIFIGLDSPVVKSHGGTDFIGLSNSIDVCNRIIKGDLINKIRANI